MKSSDNVYFVDSWTPLCVIVDKDDAHRNHVSSILKAFGIDAVQCAQAYALREGLSRRTPDLVFLAPPPMAGADNDEIRALAERSYGGPVQLMSSQEPAELEGVVRLGARKGLRMLPVLRKPIDPASVGRLVREHGLDGSGAQSGRTSLEEALRNKWVEFWYQPKINLRKKQLAGAEVFARVRHPKLGILFPAAFMETARERSLVELTEKSIVNALATGMSLSRMGIRFPLAVNVSMAALVKLPVKSIVDEHRRNDSPWPGLILDITEDQIASDLALFREFSEYVRSCGIDLAIDDFGRGYLPLGRLNEIPFAELKLDRSFIADCTTDKKQAALCKTVIDLAHNFEATAVAVGVEKAVDAHNLFRLGCDLGQGYLFAQPMTQEQFMNLLKQRAEAARARLAGAAAPR